MGPLRIKPMKIWQLPENKTDLIFEIYKNGEYFAQEKIDGYFYQFEKTDKDSFLFSRNISRTTGTLTDKIENVPHIKNALDILPPGTIVLGEVYIPGGTSKDVTKIMGCLSEKAIERQNKDGYIHYYIHDIIYFNGVKLLNVKASTRYKILKKVYDKYNLSQYNFLRLADYVTNNIEEYTNNILNNGGEGVVLKKKNGLYYPDKRPAWETIKIKTASTLDVVCIGFCPATKEYTGKELNNWNFNISPEGDRLNGTYEELKKNSYNPIPVTKGYYYNWMTSIEIGAYNEDGKIQKIGTVSSGLTEELCAAFSSSPGSFLGKVCEIKCMMKDNNEKTLRHAIFKGFRLDKPSEDCKIEEIFS